MSSLSARWHKGWLAGVAFLASAAMAVPFLGMTPPQAQAASSDSAACDSSVPAPAGSMNVFSDNFDCYTAGSSLIGNGSSAWVNSGDDKTSIVSPGENGSAGAVSLVGRANTYSTPQVDLFSMLKTGVTYTATVDVRLASADSTPGAVIMGANEPGASNQYPWVGGATTISSSTEWTKLTGTFTLDSSATGFKLGFTAQDSIPDIVFDNFQITQPGGCDSSVPNTAANSSTVYSDNFDCDTVGAGSPTGWAAGPDGVVSIVSPGEGGSGNAVALTGRTNTYDAPKLDLLPLIKYGQTLNFSFDARLADGNSSPTGVALNATEAISNGDPTYPDIVNDVTVSSSTQWTKISGQVTVPNNVTTFQVNVSGDKTDGSDLGNIVFDNFSVTTSTANTDPNLPSLYKNAPFPVGVALSYSDLQGQGGDLTDQQFNQITPENSMKVESWYGDAEDSNGHAPTSKFPTLFDDFTDNVKTATDGTTTPDDHNFDTMPTAQNTVDVGTGASTQAGGSNADANGIMNFAVEHGKRVYGHNLCWYQQTPMWFFTDDQGNLIKPTQTYTVPVQTKAADGTVTTTTKSETGADVMRARLKNHIKDVATYLYKGWGAFGSKTNPLVSFDTVNEAIDDGAPTYNPKTGDIGFRNSYWVQTLGDEYVKDAFQDANLYFDTPSTKADPLDPANEGGFAAADSKRPIALFYNDNNTELPSKNSNIVAMVKDLIAQNVPIDGIGNQFHVTLATQISNLSGAIDAQKVINDGKVAPSAGSHPLDIAVTELDLPTGNGNPASEAELRDQGYAFYNIYKMLYDESKAGTNIFSVTVWDLYDSRNWHYSAGAPDLFNNSLQAKYAWCGAYLGAHGMADTDECYKDAPAGGISKLLPRILSQTIFKQGKSDVDVAGGTTAVKDAEWVALPLTAIKSGNTSNGFSLRWTPDHLVAYVAIKDATKDATDSTTLKWATSSTTTPVNTVTVMRDGTLKDPGKTGAKAVVVSTTSGWKALVDLPLAGLTTTSKPGFDVSYTDGSTATGWNAPGNLGILTLNDTPLEVAKITEAPSQPALTGKAADLNSAMWKSANSVLTDQKIAGNSPGSPDGKAAAQAKIYQLWYGQSLYIIADVTDPTPDVTSGNAYEQDSLETFIQPGNEKTPAYGTWDEHMRVNSANKTSDLLVGVNGDVEMLAEHYAVTTSTGYILEEEINLQKGDLKIGDVAGLQYELNDGEGGKRINNYAWAPDPSGTAYQYTNLWGTAVLTAATVPPAAKTYSVKYNANGGSGAPASQVTQAGGMVTLSSKKPVRSGYTFKGWATSKTATSAKYQAGAKTTITKDTTLYAVWAKTPVTSGAVLPVYRLYNTHSGEHFYTESLAEKKADVAAGWRYEGIGWYAPKTGKAVYRVFNPNTKGAGSHYYTASLKEAKGLVAKGWQLENKGKPVFYSGGSSKVYVAYNPNNGGHNYTKSLAEQKALVKLGWKGAVAFYAVG